RYVYLLTMSSSLALPSRLFFFLTLRPPPISTLFPYTTLFRSCIPTGGARWQPPQTNEHFPASSRAGWPYSRDRKVRRERSAGVRSEEHTSELQSPCNLVCRLLLEKKKNKK